MAASNSNKQQVKGKLAAIAMAIDHKIRAVDRNHVTDPPFSAFTTVVAPWPYF